MYVSVIGESLV